MIPAVDKKILVLLNTKRVVHPEELRWFVRVPAVGNCAGVIEFEHQGTPLVDSGHREHGSDCGFASGWFSDEQHEPVLVERRGGPLVGVCDDDLGEVLAHRLQDNACLSVGAVAEDLTQVAQSVDAWDEHTKVRLLANLLLDPAGAEDSDVLRTGLSQDHFDVFATPAGEARVRHEYVGITQAAGD